MVLRLGDIIAFTALLEDIGIPRVKNLNGIEEEFLQTLSEGHCTEREEEEDWSTLKAVALVDAK